MNNPGVWSLAASDIAARTTTLVRGVVAYSGSSGPGAVAEFFVPTESLRRRRCPDAQLSGVSGTSPITSTPTRTYPMVIGSTGGMGRGGMTLTINGLGLAERHALQPRAERFGATRPPTSGMMAGMMYRPMASSRARVSVDGDGGRNVGTPEEAHAPH
jgi:hypothetical protein